MSILCIWEQILKQGKGIKKDNIDSGLESLIINHSRSLSQNCSALSQKENPEIDKIIEEDPRMMIEASQGVFKDIIME